jgi:superfamily II DNA or RNA helicase
MHHDIVQRGSRVLLFSQWSEMLDILEELCDELGMGNYLRLDGRTPVADRQAMIDAFNDDEGIPVFLLSTRAGLGINLTGADTCIFHDVSANAGSDQQALSRCYRLGQSRGKITVHKMLTEDTVDATVADLAARRSASLSASQTQQQQQQQQQLQQQHSQATGASVAGGGGGGGGGAGKLQSQMAWADIVHEALESEGLVNDWATRRGD